MGLFSSIFGKKENKDKKVQSHRQEPKEKPASTRRASHNDHSQKKSHLERGQVLEGTITDVGAYGVMVDVGRDIGFVHVSNLSWGYLTKKDIAAFYHEGQKVHVVVLGYNERGQLQLGIKQLLTFEYDEGSEVKVIVRKKSETYRLECITTDKNHVNCFIPANELSWKQDVNADDLIGQSIVIKVLRFNANKNQITASLRQMTAPWTIPNDIKEGKCIEVRVTALRENGILVSTVNEGILGKIYRNQITWLVADKDITKDDCPKINDIVRVVVKKFRPQTKKLLCSLKELQPNPWDDMQAGKVVGGTAIAGGPGKYTIRLDNGIKSKCDDAVEIPLGQSFQFVIKNADTISRTAEVSKQAVDDNVKNMDAVGDFFKHRAIRLHAFIIKGIVLLPQDVLCDGNPIAMPFALNFINYVNNHPESLVKYKEMGEISTPQGKYTRISVNVQDLGYNIPYSDIDALRNAEVNIGNIAAETENGYIVEAACRLGYIEKGALEATEEINHGQKARFVTFGNELCLDRIDIDEATTEERLQSQTTICFILTTTRLKCWTKTTNPFLKHLQTVIPELTRAI